MKTSGFLQKLFHNRNLSFQLRLSIILASVISAILVGFIWLSFETGKLKDDMERANDAFFESKQEIVKNVVVAAIDYIEYTRSLSKERMKEEIKLKVDEAWNIADNIYKQNIGSRPVAEIEKMIKDAIRPIRYANERGDVFIYAMDGKAIMIPRSPHNEGKNSIEYKDQSGKFVVRNEVNLLKQVDWGYLDYYEPGPYADNDSVLLKSTYVRKYEPLGWYFGTKDYYADFEGDIKDEILNRFEKIRFETDGYVFINSIKGEALLRHGEKLLEPLDILASGDSVWLVAFAKQKAVFDGTGEGYVENNFSRLVSDERELKHSYIGTFKPWGWIIGAGFYSNEIEKNLFARKQELNQQRNKIVLRVGIILLLLWVIIHFFSGFLTNRIIRSFRQFEVNFRKSSLTGSEMPVDDLVYNEFRELALNVNEISNQLKITRSNLIKEQSLLRSIIDSSPDLIFFKDLNSKYVGCNSAFSKYIGIEEEELIGNTDFDYFSHESAAKYHESDRMLIEENKTMRSAEWITMQDGRRLLMDTLKVLYRDKAGKALGIMAISRDITELEEVKTNLEEAKEKAEESDKLKTAFLANMSHEIRTPMNAIVGFASLLTDESLSAEDKKEYANHINQGSETLLNLIDDIIDIAKIESGQLNVYMQPMNLKVMMDELHTMFLNQIKIREKEHIKLIQKVEDLSEGFVVNSDEFRLRQVVINLVINAVKFTSEGSITYGFRQTDDYLEFYVKDTGIGISPQNQSVIFERFRQDKSNGMTHSGGTGLGLAISTHIVELLGGVLSLESEQGKGSVFTFTMPYLPVDKKTQEQSLQAADETLPDVNWEGKTLLVVEDDETHYKFMYAALARTGLSLLKAADAKQALELIKENQNIDIVLMDEEVNMPGLKGLTPAIEMKKIRPAVPVVMQIAGDSEDKKNESKKPYGDAFLYKPFRLISLFEVLGKFLG